MIHFETPNPHNLHGMFSLVREGAPPPDLEKDQTVEIRDARKVVLGYGKLRDVWVGDLALLPASIVEMEQNPVHRTYSGLVLGLRCLSTRSGDHIGPKSMVTAYIINDFKPLSIHQ